MGVHMREESYLSEEVLRVLCALISFLNDAVSSDLRERPSKPISTLSRTRDGSSVGRRIVVKTRPEEVKIRKANLPPFPPSNSL